jgi:hypothetical protein
MIAQAHVNHADSFSQNGVQAQWRKSWWGGAAPPHLHGKLTNFRTFWPKRGLKTVFSSANGGTSEIWKFCRKFRALCPPPPTGKSEFPPLSRRPGTPIEQKMDAFGHPNSGEKGKLFSIISLSLIYLKQNSFNSHYYYTLIWHFDQFDENDWMKMSWLSKEA